jgi:hypothetical protein
VELDDEEEEAEDEEEEEVEDSDLDDLGLDLIGAYIMRWIRKRNEYISQKENGAHPLARSIECTRANRRNFRSEQVSHCLQLRVLFGLTETIGLRMNTW